MEDSFDVLTVLVWVGIPLALALVGLAAAMRTPSAVRRVTGYAVAVGGAWLAVAAAASIIRCPAQNETCGDKSWFVGDFGTHMALVVGLTCFFLLASRWQRRRRIR